MEKKNRPESKQSGRIPSASSQSAPPELVDKVRSSGLIFSGTVVERGKSSVPAVPARGDLLLVRLERSLRADPVLGDLRGKMITVAPRTHGALQVGQQAVFLTNSWVHGRGIAVREVDHLDAQAEDQVAAAVAQLPRVHLLDRLKSAELVVDGEVASVRPAEKHGGERKDPLWALAELRVRRVLRGAATQSARVYFPTAKWPPWREAPRFRERQRGIFILHTPDRSRTMSEAALDPGSLVALDPADFQAESELSNVEGLLATLSAEGGTR